jgi:hypothetical protein
MMKLKMPEEFHRRNITAAFTARKRVVSTPRKAWQEMSAPRLVVYRNTFVYRNTLVYERAWNTPCTPYLAMANTRNAYRNILAH